MRARFDGRCSACRKPIDAGDPITKSSASGKWVHARCGAGQQNGQSVDRRIEYPCAGATYNRPEYGVYEYSQYGRGSVLAGQERRVFLDSFATLAEAQQAYPDAAVSAGCGYRPLSLAHLSDGPDV